MNASFDHCKELYELSGWKSSYHFHQDGGVYECNNKPDDNIPAYDAGFLLRKLPNYIEYGDGNEYAGYLQLIHFSQHWSAGYEDEKAAGESIMQHICTTPEEALAKLSIALFKSGVLKKGIGDE